MPSPANGLLRLLIAIGAITLNFAAALVATPRPVCLICCRIVKTWSWCFKRLYKHEVCTCRKLYLGICRRTHFTATIVLSSGGPVKQPNVVQRKPNKDFSTLLITVPPAPSKQVQISISDLALSLLHPPWLLARPRTLSRQHKQRIMGRNAAGERLSQLDGQAPESTDFANYFCTYAFLYHQVSFTKVRSAPLHPPTCPQSVLGTGAVGRRQHQRWQHGKTAS